MPRLSTSLRQKKKPSKTEDTPPKKRSKTLALPHQLPAGEGLAMLRGWFKTLGFHPFPFQEEAWAQFRAGNSGLIHVPTGAGKTYAAYLGPLSDLIENPAHGLRILIITPLRALSRDMEKALEAPIQALGLPFRVESRTGDTSSTQRTRQRKQLPQILITTPESLNLLLSYEDAPQRFSGLQAVIVDEWHDLMTSKRGIQMELALARLRRFSPTLRTWALSATMANLQDAAQRAIGVNKTAVVVAARLERPIVIDALIPRHMDGFPWAGHLRAMMLTQLLEVLDIEVSTLIFTNVRSHAERWYQDILEARPDWAGLMALHHGSLAKREREFVEEGLKEGFIKLVICTSSLDLGVDFAPVERVFQIGSPKGVARIIQRAGRAAHRPGAECRITCVPTQALELIEISAVRKAIQNHDIEARLSLKKPYDVLVQHLVTCALGGGFSAEALYQEVITAVSYQDLSRDEFEWILTLVRDGGKTLGAYPEYRKIELREGVYEVPDKRVAQLHRFNIGTIGSDASMNIAFLQGKSLGQVEESFVSRLKKGDVFTFAGRVVEFVTVREMTAYVRLASKKTTVVPRWSGGRLPISASLAAYFRKTLERNVNRLESTPDIQALKPILALQKERSVLPKAHELLAEFFKSRQGYHLFLYPFEGRMVHEGLAALLAYRFSKTQKLTFQMTVNDYGIEFLSSENFPFQALLNETLFSPHHVAEDLQHSLNMSELARRQFRDIARVAGLIYQNYPGTLKSSRQLNTSSSVLYDVFTQFEPDSLLLHQARQEVLENQFEQGRLIDTLTRLGASQLRWKDLKKPSPLCFPLMAERISSQPLRASNETAAERIWKMQQQWLK
ncbi:ligase-associated DNA damage response DEXH box helicase [Vampirovibrio sp.]|uniref:ligase-associated DNA damage response DEXH box helicase n=1 Tax=Vampirovibrio sp. TaxID=2717857 RepID=UPI0035942A73